MGEKRNKNNYRVRAMQMSRTMEVADVKEGRKANESVVGYEG
jgi:hypothetical protein